jgi:hypothetical protein
VSLLLILAVGGGYFLAASMVFPSPGAEVRDLDTHFMDNRRVALLAIAACNLVYLVLIAVQADGPLRAGWWIGNALFLALLMLAAFTRDRRVVLATLAILIVAHGVLLVFG